MNTDNGALEFDSYLNNEKLISSVNEAERRIKGLSDATVKETDNMDKAFNRLGGMVAGYFGTQALIGFTRQLVNVRGEFQQLDVAFTTMLGSKDKANKLMAQIVDTAAKTPFTLTEVASGAKQLLAYQVAAEDVNDTVIRLGNIAAGVSVPLDRLILAYGQVKAKGRLMGDDMRQFTEAGIPIIHELAKVMGVADNQIQKMVEDGKIGFPEVQKVMQNLTNEGGMFYNLMEKQSHTLTGQISNLQDAWDRMLNSIGQSNEGVLSGAITSATYLVEHYQDILDVIIPLVSAYGAYKAALMLASVAQKAAATATFISEYLAMGRALGFATANQIAFNRSVLANPYAIAAAAIAGLVVAIYELSSAERNLSQTERSINAVKEKSSEKYDEEKAKITSLISVLDNEKVALDSRQKALKDIQAIIPGYHASLTTEGKLINDNRTAIDDYLKSLEKQIYLQATMDEKIELTKKKRLQEKEVARKEANAKMAEDAAKVQVIGASQFSTGGSDMLAIQARGFVNSAKKELDEINKAIKALDDEYVNISNSANKATNSTQKAALQNKEFWEAQKKEATNKRDLLADTEKGSKLWKQYTDQIEEANKHLAAYNDKATVKAESDQKKNMQEFNDEKVKVQEKYDSMELERLRSHTEDKKALIDLDLKATLSEIDKMQVEYEKKAKKAGLKNPDLSLFVNMRTSANNKATQDKNAIDSESQKKALDELLSKYKTTQQKMLDLQTKYNSDSEVLNNALMKAKTDDEKKQIQDALSARKDAFNKDKAALDVEGLMQSTDWKQLFGNLDTLTVQKMIELRDRLEAEWEKLDLPPDQLKAIREQLDKVDIEIKEKNPFAALFDSINKIKEAKTTEDISASFKKMSASVVASAEYIKGNLDNIFSAMDALGVKGMDNAAEIANQLSSMAGDAANLAMGIATGNPLQIIQSSISLITKGIKLIAEQHDRKFEKSIEQHKKAVDDLQISYEKLERAIDKALGDDKFLKQKKLIDNLKQQQQEYIDMIDAEEKKKKTDADKIKEYQNSYDDATNKIEDTINSMREQILGSDVKSAADNLGEALIEAFAKGEDAAAAWGKTVDEIISKVIKNIIITRMIEQPVANIINKYLDSWVDENGNVIGNITNSTSPSSMTGGSSSRRGNTSLKSDVIDDSSSRRGKTSTTSNSPISNGSLSDQVANSDRPTSTIGVVKPTIGSGSSNTNVTGLINSAEQMGNELDAIGPKLYAALQALPDDVKKYLQLDASAISEKGMSGAIKGMSEETASLISGQLNAIRINQFDSIDILRKQLISMDKIAANTAYNKNLVEILDVLKQIKSSDSLKAYGL